MKKILSAMVLGAALMITTVPKTNFIEPKLSTPVLSATRPVYPPVIFLD